MATVEQLDQLWPKPPEQNMSNDIQATPGSPDLSSGGNNPNNGKGGDGESGKVSP